MATLEGKWNCSQCRTIGIPGLTTSCPNCNDPRNQHLDPEEAPYLPSDAREITDQAGLNYANSGPSWNCGACGTENRGDITSCTNCQARKDSDDMVAGVYTYVSGVDALGKTVSDEQVLVDDRTDAILRSADKLQPLEDHPVVMPARTFSMSALPRQGMLAVRDSLRRSESVIRARSSIVMLCALALLLIGSVAGTAYIAYALFFKTHDVTLTVQDMEWERQVEVEEFRTLTREDWSMPGDARIKRSYRAVHHYQDVLVRYEKRSRQVPETKQTGSRSEQYACGSTTVNNGNGTYSSRTTYCTRSVPVYTTTYRTEYYDVPIYRKDPVYQTKYVYEIDRWVTDHFDKASGDTNPYWPKPEKLSDDQRVGDERKASYTALLTDEEGRKFERDLKYSQWSHLEVGESVAAKQNRRGSVRSITWPSS